MVLLLDRSIVKAESQANLQASMPHLTLITDEEGFTKSNSEGFFDLDFKPGEAVVLGVKIQNVVDREIKVEITPGTVITNQGHIVYGDQSNQMIDSSNRHRFSKMVKKQTITVEPKGTVTVKIPVTVPKEKFDGTILGNLAFTVLGQEQQNKTDQKSMAMITNVVRQAIVVRMKQGVQPEPNFEIGNPATGGTINGPTFTIPIRNTAATYFKENVGTRVDYEVTKKGNSKVKYTHTDKNISMAPNSFYNGVVDTKGQTIEPGEYQAKIAIKYKGKTTKFSRDFKVSRALAKNINKGATVKTKKPQSGLNFLVIAIIFVLLLVLLVALYAGMRRARKQMKKDKKRPYRTLRSRKK